MTESHWQAQLIYFFNKNKYQNNLINFDDTSFFKNSIYNTPPSTPQNISQEAGFLAL
jgi:hypothetical protein